MRDTRAELLHEAETLLRSRGYSGFSYADLAQLVGIRKASIHHHFPTKTDLALALLTAYRDRYAAGLDAIGATSGDAITRIEAYADYYLQGVETGLGCLCAALAAELETLPDALRLQLSGFFEAHIAWLGDVVRDGQIDGTIRASLDPAATARLIVATLEGALMMERIVGGRNGFLSIRDALSACLR